MNAFYFEIDVHRFLIVAKPINYMCTNNAHNTASGADVTLVIKSLCVVLDDVEAAK